MKITLKTNVRFQRHVTSPIVEFKIDVLNEASQGSNALADI